jgi:hypothetical protein
MKVVRFRQEAQHKGYRIEGEGKAEGWILRVTPVRAGLANLPCRRFRMIRGSWAKAVLDVSRYIDQNLQEAISAHAKTVADSNKLKAEEILRLRARLLAELKRLRGMQNSLSIPLAELQSAPPKRKRKNPGPPRSTGS